MVCICIDHDNEYSFMKATKCTLTLKVLVATIDALGHFETG